MNWNTILENNTALPKEDGHAHLNAAAILLLGMYPRGTPAHVY